MSYNKIFLIFILTSLCAACQPSLRKMPVEPRSIAGEWVTDAKNIDAITEQLKTALKTARQKEWHDTVKRYSHHAESGMGEQGEMNEDRPRTYGWERRDQREQYQALFDSVRPVAEMKIEQVPGQITFIEPDMPQRNFEPGSSSTLVTTFANLHVTAGWQRDDFIVHSRDKKADIDILERYHLRTDGPLSLTVILSAPSMDTQQYTLLYHRRGNR